MKRTVAFTSHRTVTRYLLLIRRMSITRLSQKVTRWDMKKASLTVPTENN